MKWAPTSTKTTDRTRDAFQKAEICSVFSVHTRGETDKRIDANTEQVQFSHSRSDPGSSAGSRKTAASSSPVGRSANKFFPKFETADYA
jgi:hypothetical protein